MNISHGELFCRQKLSAQEAWLGFREHVGMSGGAGVSNSPLQGSCHKAHWVCQGALGVRPNSRGGTLKWAFPFPFPGPHCCWLNSDQDDGSCSLAFLPHLLLSWASTVVCSLNNWGDHGPGPANSPTNWPLYPPLDPCSCFLGFLFLRVLPEVWVLNHVQTPGSRGSEPMAAGLTSFN